ncbi:MAG: hypothetical protein HZB91_00850 [Elusimicrobia bacterium]|nr:hypothetical protein [Elusimicrobiota bacterium]
MFVKLIVKLLLLGMALGSSAHAEAPLLKKDPLVEHVGLIQPERLRGARVFRLPVGFDGAGAPIVFEKTPVVLGMTTHVAKKAKKEVGPATERRGAQLGDYIRNNSNWMRAVELINDPRFVYVSPVQQELLKTEYAARDGERAGMLPKADGLDVEDVEFAERKRKLDIESERLDREIEEYNNQVDYHNSICNPAPDEQTYRWCVENKKRLDAWKVVLLDEIGAYNREVERYNREQEGFAGRWNAFVDVILAWEGRVKEFIGKMERALRMPDVGWCKVLDIVRDPVDGHVVLCKFLCNINGVLTPYNARPFPTGKPCGADIGEFFPMPPAFRSACEGGG